MIYILLPAYNEKRNLVKMFQKIEKICEKINNITVVLVDDFSTDNTILLKNKKYQFKLIYQRHKRNKGLSITLETGFNIILKKAKRDDIVVTLDSDNTHPVSIIPGMIKKIHNGNQVVIASRFVSTSRVNGLTIWRHILSIGAKYLFKLLHPYKNLNDYTCNFRAYKFELIKKVLQNKNFFKNEDFNIAAKIILFLINKYKNLKLIEVPFTLSYDYKIGLSKMKLTKTIFLTLRLLFFKRQK
jgi:dolichol-phosphate mannosyltransferase|tara:strand:+ start:364 stop:1089 length:726 start_codon:yes stop_codon:yes gene_type:complete